MPNPVPITTGTALLRDITRRLALLERRPGGPADSGWVQITNYPAGWSGFSAIGWTGMWVRRVGNKVTVNGAVSKTTAPIQNEVMFTLPDGFWPDLQTLGAGVSIPWPVFGIDGKARVTAAGSTAPSSIHAEFYTS